MIANNNDAVASLAKIAQARQAVRTAEEHLVAVRAGLRHAIAKHREALANLAKLLDGETADLPLFDAQPSTTREQSTRPRKAKPKPMADAGVKPQPTTREQAPPGEDEYGVSRRTSGGTFAVGTVFARTKSEATDRAADTWPQFTRDEIVLSRIVRAPETAP